jgi:hypothetical protein
MQFVKMYVLCHIGKHQYFSVILVLTTIMDVWWRRCSVFSNCCLSIFGEVRSGMHALSPESIPSTYKSCALRYSRIIRTTKQMSVDWGGRWRRLSLHPCPIRVRHGDLSDSYSRMFFNTVAIVTWSNCAWNMKLFNSGKFLKHTCKISKNSE